MNNLTAFLRAGSIKTIKNYSLNILHQVYILLGPFLLSFLLDPMLSIKNNRNLPFFFCIDVVFTLVDLPNGNFVTIASCFILHVSLHVAKITNHSFDHVAK